VVGAPSPLDRALLSLEGLALGDAFGERFFRPDALACIRSRWVPDGEWRWTDDTAMAASIVETLHAHGSIDQDDLARRFAKRYRRDPGRGYSAATQNGLGEISAGRDWRSVAAGQFGGRGSFGNGAAMRAPVLGAWFAEDLERVAGEALRSAEVTHTHPEGIAGAVAVAAALACRHEDCRLGPGSLRQCSPTSLNAS
jgi:ADP-ribosylglycohydrolase